MSRTSTTLIACAILSSALAGCTSHLPSEAHALAAAPAEQALQAVPVFVVPNCQPLAGVQRCQWIEPRGYQPSAPAPASVQRVQGIAL